MDPADDRWWDEAEAYWDMGEAKRKREQFRKTPKPCVYCGAGEGITKDHVPPKALFIAPRPALITVPACRQCNEGASTLDEDFKVFLSILVGVGTAAGRAFWEEGGIGSIRNNNRLSRRIAEGKPVLMTDQYGTVGEGRAVLWQTDGPNLTLDRTTRGLYWHHFGDALPPSARIEVEYYREFVDELRAMFAVMQHATIGGKERLLYGYQRKPDEPIYSAWLYQFYEAGWAAVYTSPGLAPGESEIFFVR